ncbi:MAG TPA: histidine kinase [Candidatus Limnocylindrales bacterium]
MIGWSAVEWAQRGQRVRAWAGSALDPSGPPPRPSWRGQVLDALFAVVFAIAVIHFAVTEWNDTSGESLAERPELILLGVVAAGALALRRRYPLMVLWIILLATMVTHSESPRLTFFACVVAAYSAAAYSPYRLPTYASLAVAAMLYAQARGDVPAPAFHQPGPFPMLLPGFDQGSMMAVPEQYVTSLILIPIVVLGAGLRVWRLRAREGQARLAAMEREQAEALRRAADQERARIARELHDVVTHNVSMMVIQAGAARRMLQADPEQSRESLLAVEAGGRAALTELRHVMGLLTMPDGQAVDLAPQPGLEQLQKLVQRVQESGVTVELKVTGAPRPVPAGESLAAYRVVQEALTNTVKHAAGAPATVIVDYAQDHLRIDVTDCGGARSATVGSGRGLLGLRERLAVYGGTLRAGPRPASDGYRVTAVIPIPMELA